MIQWNHSEPIEWAQIASNYEETTYHAEKVMFNHSPMEETEPYGTDAKTDKMAASKRSQGLGMLKGAFVWKIPVMMQYSSVLHHPRHPLGMPSGISRLRI